MHLLCIQSSIYKASGFMECVNEDAPPNENSRCMDPDLEDLHAHPNPLDFVNCAESLSVLILATFIFCNPSSRKVSFSLYPEL